MRRAVTIAGGIAIFAGGAWLALVLRECWPLSWLLGAPFAALAVVWCVLRDGRP